MKIVISNSTNASNLFLDRISLIQGDITEQQVDAIAILISQRMDFSGSLNQSVMRACGHDLDGFILDNIYKPKIGEVYALPAFDLPARHILLGVMPHYRTEFDMNDSDLSGVVRKIMELARCMLLTKIAIPALGSGKKSFPKAKAARLVTKGIVDRMEESFEDVRIVCNDKQKLEIFSQKLKTIGWNG